MPLPQRPTHIMTPYPGTRLYEKLRKDGRILHNIWDLYDTRHVVYQPKGLTPQELEEGYQWAYKAFYSWENIIKASLAHEQLKHQLKHLFYTGGWKKFENFWGLIINSGALRIMQPFLELLLSEVKINNSVQGKSTVLFQSDEQLHVA